MRRIFARNFYFDFFKFSLLGSCLLLSACMPGKAGKISVQIKNSKTKTATNFNITVSNIQVVNHQIVITGTNLTAVTGFQVKDGGAATTLAIESQTNTTLVANTLSNVTFAAGKILDFIFSNASAAATFTVNFSLCDSTLGGKAFDCALTPNDKEVLSYDAVSGKWQPRPVSGLSYQGALDASGAAPTSAGPSAAGDYYIISVAGNGYQVGDWAVDNGTTMDRIDNSTLITSVFGRTGAVTALEGDYNLDKLSDVTITGAASGNVLKYNGAAWVNTAETDPTVTAFAKATLPTCAAGEVLKGNGTSLSCVTDNTGAGAFTGTANRAVVTSGAGALTVATATDTEINYLSGVTSAIQTQLDAKATSASIIDWSTAGVQTLEPTRLNLTTANRAVVTSAGGVPTASAVTTTELGYVSGVTSSIQTQLNSKAAAYTGTMNRAVLTDGATGALTTSSVTNTELGYLSGVTSAIQTQINALGAGVVPANTVATYVVRAATTANITLSGAQTIDGVSVVATNRVLVKNQTAAEENGVYVAAAGAWARASDMDSWVETNGYVVQVTEGTAWAGMTFSSATTVGGTLNTTAINWNSNGVGANTAVGLSAGKNITSGVSVTAIGNTALSSNTTGSYIVAVGANALAANTTSSFSTAVGYGVLQVSTAARNTGLGNQALRSTTTGSDNIAIGSTALYSNVTGAGNIAIGNQAMWSGTNKSESTAVGYYSMYYADSTAGTAGAYNTALGAYSLQGTTTASANTGTYNTALGHSSLKGISTGSANIGIGYNAGSAISTGSNNVVIGSHTGSTIATSSNNVLIADGAGNERVLIDTNGYMGVGASSPEKTLHVKSSNAAGSAVIERTTASTNADVPTLLLRATSTGDMSTAFGPSMLFTIGDTGVAESAIASIRAVRGGADNSGDLTFHTYATGTASEQLRIKSDGTFGFGTASTTAKITLKTTGDAIHVKIPDQAKFPLRIYNETFNTSIPTFDIMALDDGSVKLGTSVNKSLAFYTNFNTNVRMTITNGGNVGIGVTGPAEKLEVDGNIKTTGCLYYASSSLGSCASDKRLKKDVLPFELGLEELLGINPVKFKYNGLAGFRNDGKEQLGVIAQDVEKVAPSLIKKQMVTLNEGDQEKTEIKGVDYGAFIYMVINSIKDFYHKWFDENQKIHRSIAAANERVARVEKENAELKKRLETIEKALVQSNQAKSRK